jgi:hypothetical protein
MFTSPSAVRGTPGGVKVGHWAAVVADSNPATTAVATIDLTCDNSFDYL